MSDLANVEIALAMRSLATSFESIAKSLQVLADSETQKVEAERKSILQAQMEQAMETAYTACGERTSSNTFEKLIYVEHDALVYLNQTFKHDHWYISQINYQAKIVQFARKGRM